MSTGVQPEVVPTWGELATDPGDMVQPSNTQIQDGWQESATPPARQYFNWFQNFLFNASRYLLQRGITDYNSAETYQLNARLIGDDGNTYVSLQNANQGNTPSTSPTWWGLWGFTLPGVIALLGSSFVALTGYAAAIAANGYVKFPTALGGWVIQWGKTNAFPTGSSVEALSGSFPLTFPSAVYAMVANADGAIGSNTWAWATVSSLSDSGWTITLSAQSGNSIANTVHCYWVAIGK